MNGNGCLGEGLGGRVALSLLHHLLECLCSRPFRSSADLGWEMVGNKGLCSAFRVIEIYKVG